MRRLVLAAMILPLSGAAQIEGSIGMGVGSVRFPGGTSFGSAILSPTVRYSSATVAADALGSLASLPGSVWSSQARASVWATTPPLSRTLRLAGEAMLIGSSLSGGGGTTGAAHGLAELVWAGADRWGIGIGAGPSTGMVSGEQPVVALHTRARGWWRAERAPGAPDLQLLIEPTEFPAGWFTDATAGAVWQRGRAVVSLSVVGRVSSAYGSKAAGSAFLQWYAKPRVAVELGGGSVLNDPYQDLPRAGFFLVGVRLHGAPRPPPETAAPKWGPLVADKRGDSVVVRFRFAGARSVAIAGDWNAWQLRALRPLEGGVFEGLLALARGVYHFNLLVDGADWVVPNGVATVPDGMGGMVAVLVVP